jgi:hypothetical protein
MKRQTAVLALVGVFWMGGAARASAIRTGFDSFSLPRHDDIWSSVPSLGFTLDFFGPTYTSLYVNMNGNVTFDAPNLERTPFPLQGEVGTAILAPFFADVDTRATASDVVRYGPSVVDGHTAFGVNWIDVGYFYKSADKLNSFQVILIDRSDRYPGDADIEFNYGRLLWESGDWSGGSDGFGGLAARAGYSNGTGLPGTSYELAGSGVPGSFLDSSATGLIRHSYNSPVPGRYVFSVLHSPPAVIPAPGALALSLIGLGLVHRLRGRRIA